MSKVVDELKLFLTNLSRGSDTVDADDLLNSGIADKSVILNIKSKLGESPWNIQNLIDLGIDIIQKDNENELELKHDSSDNLISESENENENECESESESESESENEDDFYIKNIKFEKCEHIEETLKVMIQENAMNLHPIIKEFILLLIFLFSCIRKSCKNNSEDTNIFYEKITNKEFNNNDEIIDKRLFEDEKKTKIKYSRKNCENANTFYTNNCSKNNALNEGISDYILIEPFYKKSLSKKFACDLSNKDNYNFNENSYFKDIYSIFFNLNEKSRYEYNIDDIEQAFNDKNVNKVCETFYKHLHKMRKMKNEQLIKKGINIMIILSYLTYIYFGVYFLKTKNLYIKLYCIDKEFKEYKIKSEEIKNNLNKKIEELLDQLKISEKYSEEYEKFKEGFSEIKKENEKLKNTNIIIQKLKKKISLMETEKLMIIKKKEELEFIVKQKNLLIESNKIKKNEKEIKNAEIKRTKLILKNDYNTLNRIKSITRKSESNNAKNTYLSLEKNNIEIEQNIKNKEEKYEQIIKGKFILKIDKEIQTCNQEKQKIIKEKDIQTIKEVKNTKISRGVQTLKGEDLKKTNRCILKNQLHEDKKKKKIINKLYEYIKEKEEEKEAEGDEEIEEIEVEDEIEEIKEIEVEYKKEENEEDDEREERNENKKSNDLQGVKKAKVENQNVIESKEHEETIDEKKKENLSFKENNKESKMYENNENNYNYNGTYTLKNMNEFFKQSTNLLNIQIEEEKNKSILNYNNNFLIFFHKNGIKEEKEKFIKNCYNKYYLHLNIKDFKENEYFIKNIVYMNREILIESIHDYLISKYNTFNELFGKIFFYECLYIFFNYISNEAIKYCNRVINYTFYDVVSFCFNYFKKLSKIIYNIKGSIYASEALVNSHYINVKDLFNSHFFERTIFINLKNYNNNIRINNDIRCNNNNNNNISSNNTNYSNNNNNNNSSNNNFPLDLFHDNLMMNELWRVSNATDEELNDFSIFTIEMNLLNLRANDFTLNLFNGNFNSFNTYNKLNKERKIKNCNNVNEKYHYNDYIFFDKYSFFYNYYCNKVNYLLNKEHQIIFLYNKIDKLAKKSIYIEKENRELLEKKKSFLKLINVSNRKVVDILNEKYEHKKKKLFKKKKYAAKKNFYKYYKDKKKIHFYDFTEKTKNNYNKNENITPFLNGYLSTHNLNIEFTNFYVNINNQILYASLLFPSYNIFYLLRNKNYNAKNYRKTYKGRKWQKYKRNMNEKENIKIRSSNEKKKEYICSNKLINNYYFYEKENDSLKKKNNFYKNMDCKSTANDRTNKTERKSYKHVALMNKLKNRRNKLIFKNKKKKKKKKKKKLCK